MTNPALAELPALLAPVLRTRDSVVLARHALLDVLHVAANEGYDVPDGALHPPRYIFPDALRRADLEDVARDWMDDAHSVADALVSGDITVSDVVRAARACDLWLATFGRRR
jgi:hypothetical protein